MPQAQAWSIRRVAALPLSLPAELADGLGLKDTLLTATTRTTAAARRDTPQWLGPPLPGARPGIRRTDIQL